MTSWKNLVQVTDLFRGLIGTFDSQPLGSSGLPLSSLLKWQVYPESVYLFNLLIPKEIPTIWKNPLFGSWNFSRTLSFIHKKSKFDQNINNKLGRFFCSLRSMDLRIPRKSFKVESCCALKKREEKTSSQYFTKYLSNLIKLKMYRKCTSAPFAPFLMLEMLKHCLSWEWHPKFQLKEEFPLRFRKLILLPTPKILMKYFL